MSKPTLYMDLGCRHLRTCDSAVPVKPDYAAMAAFIEEIMGLPGWWAPENRQALAKALWRAGIGGDE